MVTKIIGAGSFLLGLLIVVGFPWIRTYQPESMARAGVLIGILLIVIGIFLMKI
ncbi:MAG: hypothetical protein QMD12_02225 [Candidatus Aenigmarchaeota archaeon]|nr:hypothetical protein [Candidatus Aenigmarchaeota archaeon]